MTLVLRERYEQVAAASKLIVATNPSSRTPTNQKEPPHQPIISSHVNVYGDRNGSPLPPHDVRSVLSEKVHRQIAEVTVTSQYIVPERRMDGGSTCCSVRYVVGSVVTPPGTSPSSSSSQLTIKLSFNFATQRST